MFSTVSTAKGMLETYSCLRISAGTTKTTRMPAFWGYPLPPHDHSYYWVILHPKSKEDKFKVTSLKNLPKSQILVLWNKHYTWYTFWSRWLRCANINWIRQVLLKIESGHDSVHRWTDGQRDRGTEGRTDRQTDRRTRLNQYIPLSTSLKRGV